MPKPDRLHISIIVPLYNRPKEIEELLESLTKQTFTDFEVIVVEDGSQIKSDAIVKDFQDKLNISYYFKENTGPGQSRNYGFERAKGNYGIFLDSDCVLPDHYMEVVHRELTQNYADAFGGPDSAHQSFTTMQKAINYSMTSFFTTGGIRGGGEKMEKFHPRSFNMGYSREVFNATKGFSKMRFGEDIDMSIRIIENGFSAKLYKEAYVFHKRRTNLRQFFKQIFNSGIARINLYKRHPQSLKPVHFAPAVFTVGFIFILIFSFLVSSNFLILLALHAFLLFTDAFFKNNSIKIAALAVVTSYAQLLAYGLGFIKAFYKRIILNQDEFSAFNKNFYK